MEYREPIMTITDKGIEIKSIHIKKEEKEDKLKVKVWNYKNIVMFEVLEQDESLRDEELEFKARNGWKIVSDSYPSIEVIFKTLSIRGDEEKQDRDVSIWEASTIEEAKQLVKEIKQAVREFNESQNQILDEKEKEYLNHVIAPFRDRVKYIKKESGCYREYIDIVLYDDDDIPFPYFEKGAMYKGMKSDKEYTLKELGL